MPTLPILTVDGPLVLDSVSNGRLPYKHALISALSSLLLYRLGDPLAYAFVAAIAVNHTDQKCLRVDADFWN